MQGSKASKPLTENICRVCGGGKNPALKSVFLIWVRETHRVLDCTQTHPPGNQHQKGPVCLWIAGEVSGSQHGSLSVPSPTYSTTRQPCGWPRPGEYLRLHPLKCNRPVETKKCGPSERTDQSSIIRSKR